MTIDEMIGFIKRTWDVSSPYTAQQIIAALRAGHGMYQDLKDMNEETDSVRAWDAATKG